MFHICISVYLYRGNGAGNCGTNWVMQAPVVVRTLYKKKPKTVVF